MYLKSSMEENLLVDKVLMFLTTKLYSLHQSIVVEISRLFVFSNSLL